jgi:hypothetical protein
MNISNFDGGFCGIVVQWWNLGAAERGGRLKTKNKIAGSKTHITPRYIGSFTTKPQCRKRHL